MLTNSRAQYSMGAPRDDVGPLACRMARAGLRALSLVNLESRHTWKRRTHIMYAFC